MQMNVSNLLSVNITKSCVMLVGSQQAMHTSEFAIYLNNERLEEVKYLGLEIDSLLKWNVYVKCYLELFQ